MKGENFARGIAMLSLVISLATLFVGYLALRRGPAIFSSTVATVAIATYLCRAKRSNAMLLALQSHSFSRSRDSEGWTRLQAEQKLLQRSLGSALRLTELLNQYPDAADAAVRLASRIDKFVAARRSILAD